MSLRSAPRRKVIEITKTGAWGEVTYQHRLECGHVEERKRPAKPELIGCGKCAIAKPPAPTPLVEMDLTSFLEDDFHAEQAWVEGLAGRVQAGLASRLKVDMEQVTVVVHGNEVGHAVVWLDHEAALRLSGT